MCAPTRPSRLHAEAGADDTDMRCAATPEAVGLNTASAIVEASDGFLTGSLTLPADAAQDATDAARPLVARVGRHGRGVTEGFGTSTGAACGTDRPHFPGILTRAPATSDYQKVPKRRKRGGA